MFGILPQTCPLFLQMASINLNSWSRRLSRIFSQINNVESFNWDLDKWGFQDLFESISFAVKCRILKTFHSIIIDEVVHFLPQYFHVHLQTSVANTDYYSVYWSLVMVDCGNWEPRQCWWLKAKLMTVIHGIMMFRSNSVTFRFNWYSKISPVPNHFVCFVI